ncbi:hypothetical protein SCUCBS95973_007832 [Sporothrix curviconia]|uniref:C6 zinc finger domain containing protein n=1 Tax=Sporothrix curviconia TaxID=1260050 RepID=A0ABP0CGL0_9PEZI
MASEGNTPKAVVRGHLEDATRSAGSGNESGSHVLRFRRPVLTEAERRHMSRCLVESIPPSAVGQALMTLDEQGLELATGQQQQQQRPQTGKDEGAGMTETAVRGPFGVFRFQETQQQQQQQQQHEDPSDSCETSSPDCLLDLVDCLQGDGDARRPPDHSSDIFPMRDPADFDAYFDTRTPIPITRGFMQSLFEQNASDATGKPDTAMPAAIPSAMGIGGSLQALFATPFLGSDGSDSSAVDVQAEARGIELSLEAIVAASGNNSGTDMVPVTETIWDNTGQTQQQEQQQQDLDDSDSTTDNYDHLPLLPSSALAIGSPQQQVLLRQAVPLLRYYGMSVVAFMSPFRHTHTPWHSIFLPHVKNCLAAFALSEAISEASLTTFYGTLAISAFTLGAASKSDVWLEPARAFHRLACQHARAILERQRQQEQQMQQMQASASASASTADARDVLSHHPATYKGMLMALLTMAQVSVLMGMRRQTEGFLLEAEKLVRLQGLAGRKSRKVRLLHHCYVYMRMFHESTILGSPAIESSHRQQVRHAVEWSGLVPHMRDNLSFRLLQWGNLIKAMAVLKPQLDGENDLHIARPGFFTDSMYPEIFGIPETFMFCLSQVIRLGNERDLAERGERTEADDGNNNNNNTLSTFFLKARSLESAIDTLLCGQPSSSAASAPTDNPNVLPDILVVMQCSLSIYFYRRIYNLNVALLQPKVKTVRDWLYQYERANPDLLYGSFGLLWPAFVAACEAEGADLQASFAQWYRLAAQRSGLACFDEALTIVERVWQAKRAAAPASSRDEPVTWLDVMREESFHNIT